MDSAELKKSFMGGYKKKSVHALLDYLAEENEKKLEEILSAVKGAGKVKVMITYSQGAEKIAAQETKRDEGQRSKDRP